MKRFLRLFDEHVTMCRRMGYDNEEIVAGIARAIELRYGSLDAPKAAPLVKQLPELVELYARRT